MRTLSQLRIIASLPEVQSVKLLSVTEQVVSATDVRALEDRVEKLNVVPPIFHPIHLFERKRYVPRVVALRLLGVPYLAGKWDSGALRRALRRELVAAMVDVVYIDHLGMGRYLPEIKADRPFCRTVLEQHNIESDFFKQFAAEKTGPKKIVATAEYTAARKFEERMLREVDAVVAISHEDAKQMKGLAGVSAHVVPVVMTPARKARPHQSRRARSRLVLPKGLAARPQARARRDLRDRRRRTPARCLGPSARPRPMEGARCRDRRLSPAPRAAMLALTIVIGTRCSCRRNKDSPPGTFSQAKSASPFSKSWCSC